MIAVQGISRWLLGVAALATAAATSPVSAADGRAVFDSVCAACHQAGGVGAPGVAPPLRNPKLLAKLGDDAPVYIARVMLGGLTGTIESLGTTYSGLAMPSQAHLDDKDLAAAATYVLRRLNGINLSVQPALITKLRQESSSHETVRQMRSKAPPS